MFRISTLFYLHRNRATQVCRGLWKNGPGEVVLSRLSSASCTHQPHILDHLWVTSGSLCIPRHDRNEVYGHRLRLGPLVVLICVPKVTPKAHKMVPFGYTHVALDFQSGPWTIQNQITKLLFDLRPREAVTGGHFVPPRVASDVVLDLQGGFGDRFGRT